VGDTSSRWNFLGSFFDLAIAGATPLATAAAIRDALLTI
jgi:hypothetical protein